MRVSEAFPSQYLKAADLQERQVTVKISHIEFEKIGDNQKPVVYFQGKEKGLVLNKTNANNIAFVYGDEMQDWQGGELILFPTMVDFQGKSTPAIRVKIPPRRPAGPAQQSAPAAAPKASPYTGQVYDERNPPPNEDMDDSIPF